MKFRGGEFSTGTTGNFQPELTPPLNFRGEQSTRRVKSLSRLVRAIWLLSVQATFRL